MGLKTAGIFSGLLIVGALYGLFFWGGTDEPQKLSSGAIINNTVGNTMDATSTQNPHVVFKTTKGAIELELFMDRMPITVGNFLKLSGEGYYNGTKFHRVIEGFMIQGGDPNSKGEDVGSYGTGGPGYTIQDEFVAGLSNTRGTISMANTGRPNSGGSQFFINLVDNTGLDFDKPPVTSSHPVFGRVVSGMEVIDAIGGVETDPRDLPLEPIVITEIVVR